MAQLFISNAENTEYLLSCVRRMTLTNSMGFALLGILDVLRFSIQGLGYSFAALLSGISEMIARSVIGFLIVPRFGFPGACFGNPLAWLFAAFTLILIWISVIRKTKKELAL